jgi:hypothetical protein
MKTQFNRNLLPIIGIITWFVLMAMSFWWFEYRHWQSFSNINVTFNGRGLDHLFKLLPSGSSGKIRVVHFTDQACACSSYSRAHIEDLQGILTQTEQFTLSSLDSITDKISIPATPSVAVWDQQGELAYFGPYSGGAVCGEGSDFVSRVVDELNQHRNPKWINMLGIGCYCPWPKQENHNA